MIHILKIIWISLFYRAVTGWCIHIRSVGDEEVRDETYYKAYTKGNTRYYVEIRKITKK